MVPEPTKASVCIFLSGLCLCSSSLGAMDHMAPETMLFGSRIMLDACARKQSLHLLRRHNTGSDAASNVQ